MDTKYQLGYFTLLLALTLENAVTRMLLSLKMPLLGCCYPWKRRYFDVVILQNAITWMLLSLKMPLLWCCYPKLPLKKIWPFHTDVQDFGNSCWTFLNKSGIKMYLLRNGSGIKMYLLAEYRPLIRNDDDNQNHDIHFHAKFRQF